jgi:2-desacetyl-2-hydroxyethyl bacteriochlorophyllide A dehydrogenase
MQVFNNSVKAVQLIEHGAPGKLEIVDLPDPRAAADEVVVRVHACGLNRIDLWAEEAKLPVRIDLPLTPGCEIAGEVESVGSNISGWRPGDRVAIQSNLFCGECEFCLRGEESVCLKGGLLGVQRHGGFAEKVVVPALALVRLPQTVAFETAAALGLAASTAMHMLTHRTKVLPGFWVLVIGGASGVGSAAVQIAKQLGAYVITTGSSEAKRDLGKTLGADFVLDATNPEWPAEVRKLTQKRGVDLVVEHVGGEVLMKCLDCLARNGTIVTCGATAGRDVPLQLWPFFVKQQRLIGSYGRNRADLTATLEWASQGRIKPVIHRQFPLAETSRAYAVLRNRDVLGKVVVLP